VRPRLLCAVASSQYGVLPPCLCASVRAIFFLTEARRHRVPGQSVCRSRPCRHSLSWPTVLASSPVAFPPGGKPKGCAPSCPRSTVLPPCLCASVRVMFSHRGTETQSSWSLRMPLKSQLRFIIVAQRSGFYPFCLSRPAERRKVYPHLLPIHGSSSVSLCLRESNFSHGGTETQSSGSLRMPLTSLQRFIVAAHSSGFLPSC